MNPDQGLPPACYLGALGEARERYQELRKLVGRSIAEVQELPDGYALRLPSTAEVFSRTAEWISLEQRCCPFINFALDWRPPIDTLWLRLTGADGAKLVIAAALAVVPGPIGVEPTIM